MYLKVERYPEEERSRGNVNGDVTSDCIIEIIVKTKNLWLVK